MHAHFVSKENLFGLCLVLNDWNDIWNKSCNLPSLAICCFQLPLLIFLRHPDIKKQKLGCEWACEIKVFIIILKAFIKQPVIKQKSNFTQFFFSHWLLRKGFFFFLIKALANLAKLIRFHGQAFIAYKSGENLKILIEIFCQKSIVSNVILKIFFVSQAFSRHRAPLLFKIFGSSPGSYKH